MTTSQSMAWKCLPVDQTVKILGRLYMTDLSGKHMAASAPSQLLDGLSNSSQSYQGISRSGVNSSHYTI